MQNDATKLIPWLQSQRNAAHDALAQCSAICTDQQARIAELESQLAAAKAEAQLLRFELDEGQKKKGQKKE